MQVKNIDFTKWDFLWEKSDVCLLNIPCSQLSFPSIGLGILKATLNNTDISASVVYANLLFAEAIGFNRYRRITEFMHPATFIQEWLFSHQAFPESENKVEDYLNLIEPQIKISSEVALSSSFETVEKVSTSSIKNDLILTRRIADEFITELAQLVLAKKPKIVACSSVFAQQVASLALLRVIKKLSPETITLIGGYNSAGEMGLTTITEFPWIDMVFSGEADESFYDMCKLLIANGADVSPEQLPAGAFNKKKAREFIAAEIEGNSCEQYGIAKDLNKVPEPDYREYFTTVRQMSYYKHIEPTINVLLESSRGCWWYRCTFCGHNPYTKKHRKKDHQKVLGSIASCGEKYGAYNIEFTDNILSMDYFDDLIPALATLPEKYKIFFEVKANLKKHHIEALVNANVKWVQAGLEGLHDEILKIQKKGTSTIINIETLKNALEYGLDIWWNVLCNFPGEDMKWYNDMAKDIPLFHHLQPPATLSPIVFVRFSDYFNNQEKFGLKLRPFESLKYIYSLSEEKILRLVSFFHDENYGIQLSSKNSDKYSAIHEAIVSWQKEFYKKHPSLLIMRQNSNGTIEINDTRLCSVSENIIISDEIEIAIMRTAASKIRKHNIIEAIERICSQKYTIKDVNRAVDNLKSKNLIYEHGGNIISLPVSRRISPTMHPMREEQNFITTE